MVAMEKGVVPRVKLRESVAACQSWLLAKVDGMRQQNWQDEGQAAGGRHADPWCIARRGCNAGRREAQSGDFKHHATVASACHRGTGEGPAHGRPGPLLSRHLVPLLILFVLPMDASDQLRDCFPAAPL